MRPQSSATDEVERRAASAVNRVLAGAVAAELEAARAGRDSEAAVAAGAGGSADSAGSAGGEVPAAEGVNGDSTQQVAGEATQ